MTIPAPVPLLGPSGGVWGYRAPMAYWVLKVLLTPFFFLFWRVKVEGRENVPATGPAVLAANHQSFCDSFFLPLVVRRKVTYLAKAEYFDDWKTAWFFKAAGQIPIRRGGGKQSERALETAREVLAGGQLLGLYPKAPGRSTNTCTRGGPGCRVSRGNAGCRSSRWESWAPPRCRRSTRTSCGRSKR